MVGKCVGPTGYGWEDLRQVCATLLGARHVPERLCGGLVYLGRNNKMFTFTSTCTFTCHPTQVNTFPYPQPRRPVPVLNLPTPEGWKTYVCRCMRVCALHYKLKNITLHNPSAVW